MGSHREINPWPLLLRPQALPDDALRKYQKFDGPLIYLAAPFGYPDPEVSRDRLGEVN